MQRKRTTVGSQDGGNENETIGNRLISTKDSNAQENEEDDTITSMVVDTTITLDETAGSTEGESGNITCKFDMNR